MSVRNPYQAYKQTSVETASPGELTLMLYTGCLKAIGKAKAAIEEGKLEEKNRALQKAQDIIGELMVTLNTEYEVGRQMLRMYDYMLNRLIEANISNEVAILEEVEEFVRQFQETWKEMLQQYRRQQYGGGGQDERRV